MGVPVVEWVLEVPEPMNRKEFRHWESINRPPNMLWLVEFAPFGDEKEPCNLWRCVYENPDDVIAGLCS